MFIVRVNGFLNKNNRNFEFALTLLWYLQFIQNYLVIQHF